MRITEMTDDDVGSVTALINQLHPDEPGAVVPSAIRQGWKALVARNDADEVVGFLLGSFIDYGLAHESSGSLDQLVVDRSARQSGVGTQLVAQWKEWLIEEGVPLGFVSAEPEAVAFYERCGFRVCTGPFMVWSHD